MSYDEWLAYIFDHPEQDPAWYWAEKAPFWNYDARPVMAIEHWTRLFRTPECLIERFTPGQIGTGINYIINSSGSNYAHLVRNTSVPLELRLACLESIADVYGRLFARICPIHFGHLDQGEPANGASFVCYMLWDVFPMYGWSRAKPVDPQLQAETERRSREMMVEMVREMGLDPAQLPDMDKPSEPHESSAEEVAEAPALERACLNAMEKTLALDHPACQEGALHGLGHWEMYYPERVHPIIDAFLERDVRPEIRTYAHRAREGYVQ